MPENYEFAMHIFGLLTLASSINEFDEVLFSCTVIFSSPCSSDNVLKNVQDIQNKLTTIGDLDLDDSRGPNDFKVHD